jgi:tRNA threonylcarbamoyladenosine biosynthesis protein TsaB
MKLFAAIDASTYTGTCALVADTGEVLIERDAAMRDQEQERLMPALVSLFEESHHKPSQLAGVICGEGPGSFTSLRIAASLSKGMCHGLGIPLYAVSSLLLIPAAALPPLAPGEYLAMLDAMRNEVFALRCSVSASGGVSSSGSILLQKRADADAMIRGAHPSLKGIGPGCALDVAPHARGAAALLALILSRGPVDLATWEPTYGRRPEAEVRHLNAARTMQGGS